MSVHTPDIMVSPQRRTLAGILLATLLLLLAFRLTSTETLRENIPQKSARLAALAAPRGPDAPLVLPLIGPTFIAGYVVVVLAVAGAAAQLAKGNLSTRRLIQSLLIAVIVTLLLISVFHAGNCFNALIGAADITASLMAAWTMALLCDAQLLGAAGRRAAIAAIIAILAVCAAKAYVQYFIEIPDVAQYIREHTDEALRSQGLDPTDAVQRKLFLARANSREVTGFGAFSNVFAAQMTALACLLIGVLAGAFVRGFQPRSAPPTTPSKKNTQGEIPLHTIALIALAAVFAADLFVLPLTHSNGAMASTTLGILVILMGACFGKFMAAHRKLILSLVIVIAASLPVMLIAYGRSHNGLPTKSLLFRWQYWSATVPMLREFPFWGVGLNNFGDFYLQYKSPSSPEDVKDPHSFFIRLAAEAGFPATLAIACLLAWFLAGAFRKAPTPNTPQQSHSHGKNNLWLPALVALLWVPLHMFTTSYNDFELIMSFLYAGLGFVLYLCTLSLLAPSTNDSGAAMAENSTLRFIAGSAANAALAMLLYDQVNIALVTGPCAMLFWMLLATADSAESLPPRSRFKTIAQVFLPPFLLAASLAAAIMLLWPLLRDVMPLDPAPHEVAYIRHFQVIQSSMEKNDLQSAKREAALADEALARALFLSPNNGELYMQRLSLHRFAGEKNLAQSPLAPDIRKLLTLDRSNARIRLDLALPDSDLPPAERIAALNEALAFDQALPPDEPKRLTPQQISEVRQTIDKLQGK